MCKMENRVKDIISAVLGISMEKINNDLSPDTIESWDSLGHMNLVVALEEEFNVQFSDEEIVEMMNLQLIVEILKEKIS